MKDEEPGAQVQGCGARTWPECSWRHCEQLPAGWAAHPDLQRCHHLLLRLGHVVHQGRLRHRVRRHHLAAGVLRRVRGVVCDAAALQELNVQRRQRSPFQCSRLPCPRLTSQGHVHRPCKYIRCTCAMSATMKAIKLKAMLNPLGLHSTWNDNPIALTVSTVWPCFCARGQCQKEMPQRNTLKAFSWNQGKWFTNVQSAAASSLTERTTAGGARRAGSPLLAEWSAHCDSDRVLLASYIRSYISWLKLMCTRLSSNAIILQYYIRNMHCEFFWSFKRHCPCC